jgi:hypothetical protein
VFPDRRRKQGAAIVGVLALLSGVGRDPDADLTRVLQRSLSDGVCCLDFRVLSRKTPGAVAGDRRKQASPSTQ